MPVLVSTNEDWKKVSEIGGPIVDPMIMRCGDIFLSGPTVSAASVFPLRQVHPFETDSIWELLQTNLHGLATFFDRIILDDRIPVFDYTDSFEMIDRYTPSFGLQQTPLGRINESEEVLVDVRVQEGPYSEVKSAALEKMKELYQSSDYGSAKDEAKNILGELAAASYNWYPNIPDMPFQNDEERQLAGYILAGLVFGGYAQLAGVDHLMQSKRSRLFLATALKRYGPRSEEQELFDALQRMPLKTAEIPFVPTFFPLLLQESNNPREMIHNALRYRASSEIKDYRAWFGGVLEDFTRNGRIATEVIHEVQSIQDAVRRRAEGLHAPKLELSMKVSGFTAVDGPELKADLTELAVTAWGWFLERLPGKRYRKLLTRAFVADAEYVNLSRRARYVWQGQG